MGRKLEAKPGLDEQEPHKRHGVRGELAQGSEARTGSEQLHVNAARVRRKLSYLIRGDLSEGELEGRGQQRP